MLPDTHPIFPDNSCDAPHLSASSHHPFQHAQHPLLLAVTQSPAQAQSVAIQHPPAKKRRTDRACDGCRRKKTRCDGPWSTNNVCSNCVQAKKPCTYIEASKPRGPPKAYVTGLEDRVEELEVLLAQIKPGTDFSDELGPSVLRDSWKNPGVVVEPPRCPATDSPSRVATPQDGESQRTSAPAASPLPPLMIPFHRPKSESNLSFKSTSFKSTHLFSRRRRLKTKGSTASSDLTLSSGSGSSPIPNRAGPSHQSTSSYASSSDSEYGSHDYSDSDSEEIVETSAVGRSRYTLKMNETPRVEDNRIIFHGRSSTAGLVEATRIFKHMHMQETMGMDITKDHEGAVKREEDELNGKLKIKIEGPDNSRVAMNRRPVFWQTPPWELKYQAITTQSPLTTIPHILSQFPPPDLCRTLIKLYFFHCNNHFPLLHRPTFERQWEEKLYERNAWYACLCLLIFAVASRWCEDVRVLADHDPNAPVTPSDWTKAGWRYFEAGTDIHRVARSLFNSPTLFEIQTFTLMGMFLRGTSFAPMAWFIVSAGLRKAQDAGAHRKRTYHQWPNTDDELWKRAFWLLIVFDRVGGVLLGRGIAIGEEDFDLELPLEVDDEFWSDDTEWKQPEGRPSIMSSFNQLIKLTQIIAFAAKTVYAIDKPKIFRGLIEGDWRVEVITQLNTAMEEWLDNVPNHLRWSEDLPASNSVFYSQSAMLYSTYHVARTLIYRPFIPVPPLLPPSMQRHHKESTPPLTPFPFPALAICVTSARACTRIIEAQFRKKSWNHLNIPSFTSAAFTCAGTMILALWDLKAQQRVLVKVKNAGIISSEMEADDGSGHRDGNARAGTEELKADALLSSLKQKMENIICEVNVLLEALEWLKDRWENSSSFLSQLKESLPSAQDLQSDLELSHPPDRLSVVKQLSFQDLRRQRQQAQQEKLQKKQSTLSLDGQSGSEATFNTQKIQWLKSDANNSTSQLDPTSESIYEDQPTVQGGEPYSSVGPRIEPVDVDRFLQDHYTDLHTFADDDFDPSPESSIQLPTIPYNVSPAGHHSSRCQCPDCSGPPSRVSSTEFGNAAAQEQYPRYQQEDQQGHYQPPSNHPYRDETQIRIHPPSTSSFSFQASTPFPMSTASGPPVQDVSLRRLSHDNPGQGLHPRRDPVAQPMPSPLPVPSPVIVDTSAMPMSVPISMNRPISSLDGYSMHGQQQRRATSNERGSPFGQADIHHVQNKYTQSQPSPSMTRRSYTEYPPHTGQAWRTPNESPSSFSSFGPDGRYHEWQSTAVPLPHVASTIYQPSSHPNTSQIRLSQHPDAVHDISQQPHHSFSVSHRQYPPPRPDMGYGPMSTDFSS